MHINVIGAGLAGSEAAWQIANRGIKVKLYEMKPEVKTPAHSYNGFAELVCSNSLRSNDTTSGVGLLKEEMRRLGSLIMEAADTTAVPAGGSLAVDRYKFSDYVTNKINNHPNIEVIYGEVSSIPNGEITVVASGPLTTDKLADYISELIGNKKLSFFDAAAPIISYESIDMNKAFFASRYNKGTPDYINCPFSKEEYEMFYNALISAETAKLHDFESNEKIKVFEGCMPVEVMASRGIDTLRYGPMKPVGIYHPVTDEKYYAVVQLRKEDTSGSMYNIVGFQTHLTFPEQKRVFGLIPGLENADFYRYGVMHRNTFLHSPLLLNSNYSLRTNNKIYFAGQMTGVEGYIESAGSGLLAGYFAANQALELNPLEISNTSMIGAMAYYISHGGESDFQPMNANFGILSKPDGIRGGKKERYKVYSDIALEYIDTIKNKFIGE